MEEVLGDAALLERIGVEVAAFSGVFGFYAKNLTTGDSIGIRSHTVMPTASTIKVCILAELYRQAEAGLIDLSDRLLVTQADWTGGTGALKEFAPGLMPTVGDLARLMIVVSDNVATGMLVRLLGKDRINATIREWGLDRTELIWDMEFGDETGEYALSTPYELGRLMELIATDALVSPAACAEMRDHLARQQYVEQIPRFLPFNPYAKDLGLEQPLEVMNKTGFYAEVRADVAIIRAPETTFVIATMTKDSRDRSFRADHEGNILNGNVARLVFDAWVGVLPLPAGSFPSDYLSLAERTALKR